MARALRDAMCDSEQLILEGLTVRWLNLETSVARAPEFVAAGPRERATWLGVSLWCAEQENGGVIKDAASWPDRTWQQACGVSKRDVDSAGTLLKLVGNDLHVWRYPVEKEDEVKTKREAGRVGGIRSAQSRKAATINGHHPDSKDRCPPSSSSEAAAIGSSNASSSASPVCRTEGNGKEEEKELLTMPAPVGVAQARPRDPLFDALAAVDSSDPTKLTKSAARACAVKLAEIKRASPNVSVEEIQLRTARYRKRFRGALCTPAALAKHWAALAGEEQSSGGSSNYINAF